MTIWRIFRIVKCAIVRAGGLLSALSGAQNKSPHFDGSWARRRPLAITAKKVAHWYPAASEQAHQQ